MKNKHCQLTEDIKLNFCDKNSKSLKIIVQYLHYTVFSRNQVHRHTIHFVSTSYIYNFGRSFYGFLIFVPVHHPSSDISTEWVVDSSLLST